MVRTLYSEVVKRNLVAGGPWKKKTTESKEDGGCESHLQLRVGYCLSVTVLPLPLFRPNLP